MSSGRRFSPQCLLPSVPHVASTLTTILMFSSPSASRFLASQLRSDCKSRALSSELLRFGASFGLKEEAGPGVRPRPQQVEQPRPDPSTICLAAVVVAGGFGGQGWLPGTDGLGNNLNCPSP